MILGKKKICWNFPEGITFFELSKFSYASHRCDKDYSGGKGMVYHFQASYHIEKQ